jgi:hypothetical protein
MGNCISVGDSDESSFLFSSFSPLLNQLIMNDYIIETVVIIEFNNGMELMIIASRQQQEICQ